MSEPKHKGADKPRNPAGQVRHDKSGRAIWEWAIDTGRHAIDSTSRLLKRLEIPGLTLEEDAKKKDEGGLARPGSREPPAQDMPTFGGEREADPLAGRQGSFNPYDNRGKPPPRTSPPPKPGAKPAIRPPAAPPAQPQGLLSRLLGRRR